MDFAAIVPAGEAVRRLVEKRKDEEEDPEFRQVGGALLREAVKEQRIPADLAPVSDKNVNHEGKENRAHHPEPRCVHPLQPGVSAVEVAVGIPCRKLNVSYIELRFGMRMLVAACFKFLLQRDVLFQRRLVPEIDGVQTGGKVAQVIDFIGNAVTFHMQFRRLFPGAHAIEELDNAPLFRSEAEDLVAAADHGRHDRFSVFGIFLVDQRRIELRIADTGFARRHIRQRCIEGFGEIHWARGTRTEATIPGSRPGSLRLSTTVTSMVPLPGSTTGLRWVTAAGEVTRKSGVAATVT